MKGIPMITPRTPSRSMAFARAAIALTASFLACPDAVAEQKKCDEITTTPRDIIFYPLSQGGDSRFPIPKDKPPPGTVISHVISQTVKWGCPKNGYEPDGQKPIPAVGYSFELEVPDETQVGTDGVFDIGIHGIGLKVVVIEVHPTYPIAVDPYWGSIPTVPLNIGSFIKSQHSVKNLVPFAPSTAFSAEGFSGAYAVVQYSLVVSDVSGQGDFGEIVSGPSSAGLWMNFNYVDVPHDRCPNWGARGNNNCQGGSNLSNVFIHPWVPVRSACSITNAWNNTVNLEPTSPEKFGSVVGRTTGDKSFTLKFSCEKKQSYRILITDRYKKDNTSTALTLTPGTENPATGVGVQILAGTEILTSGRPSTALVTTDNKGAGSVTLTARYVSISDTVTPGNVNAVAEITIANK